MRLKQVVFFSGVVALALVGCSDDSRGVPEGETLELSYRSVIDPLAGNGEAYRFLLPDDWAVAGPGVAWNVGFRSGGVSADLQVSDPAVARGFAFIPYLPRYWTEPALPGFPEGSVYGILGAIATHPLSAIDYLTRIAIPDNFPANTTIIGSQQLPELAQGVAVGNGLEAVDAARTRITYNNGAADVEAHVYAWIRYDTLPGGTTLWSPVGSPAGLYAVWAPTGTLDDEAPLLNTLALSSILNPEWIQYVNLVEELRVTGNARVQEQMNQLIVTLRETNDAIFDFTTEGYRQRQEANDRIYQNYGEAIRGTETYADPGVGDIELPGGFGEVWATGTGDYILSNDPLFDPNLNGALNWDRIEASP